MSEYARPPVQAPEVRGDDGRVIRYGDRWDFAGGPPEDSYSVTSNLERFAPLHTVAEALIAYLTENYDVVVSEDPSFGADLLHERDDILRAVRVMPNAPDAAPLTFVFTSFPSVIVHAGVLQDLLFPVCGCDACDESWERLAEDMEWQIQAVAAGLLQEELHGRIPVKVEMTLSAMDGSGKIGGGGVATEFPNGRVAMARKRLAALPEGWQPWPKHHEREHF